MPIMTYESGNQCASAAHTDAAKSDNNRSCLIRLKCVYPMTIGTYTPAERKPVNQEHDTNEIPAEIQSFQRKALSIERDGCLP